MSTKEPVLLVVLIETETYRWYVGGVDDSGSGEPLICSQSGNLAAYLGQPFDEQVSFLRHRLSGVLQRGCDRLWGREKKPQHIVFVSDGPFRDASDDLTPRVAEHFVEWMTSPPVAFLLCDNFAGPDELVLTLLAGDLPDQARSDLATGLPLLAAARDQAAAWELIPTPPTA